MKKLTICSLVAAATCFAFVSISVAELKRAVNDGGDRPIARGTTRVLLTGQILLRNSGVSTLIGTPAPPPLIAFSASLRVYLSQGNTFVTGLTTDGQGRFAIALPPGRYRIVPDLMRGQQVLGPGDQEIIVTPPYESAPALEVNLARNTHPSITITYWRTGGN